jgi:hypothetical protein
MPRLSYDDVFLPEKEDVMDKISEMENQIKALTIALVKHMFDGGTRSIRINKQDFADQMGREGMKEPIKLVFRGGGDHFIISIE